MESPVIGQPAPDAVFTSRDGATIHLSDFWQAQSTIFIFLRHFG